MAPALAGEQTCPFEALLPSCRGGADELASFGRIGIDAPMNDAVVANLEQETLLVFHCSPRLRDGTREDGDDDVFSADK